MVTNRIVGFARHPGKLLAQELAAREMSQADLAVRTDLSAKAISEMLSGKAPISNETAIKLEYVLGTPAHMWNELQSNYEEALARDKERERVGLEVDLVKRYKFAEIRRIFPGIRDVKSAEERVEELKRFFGVASLQSVLNTDSARPYLAAAFRSNAEATGKAPDKYALAAWLRAGELRASQLECAPFDASKLKYSLPLIRKTIYEKSITEAWQDTCRILLGCGVKVVPVAYLSKTYVNGAVRWVGDNPVIMMSDRHAYADIFWFSLMHEICHILKHGKRYACVVIENQIGDRVAQEIEADDFASEFFLPEKEYHQFLTVCGSKDLPHHIGILSREKEVPYYIIIGRLCHDGIIPWTHPLASDRPKVKII